MNMQGSAAVQYLFVTMYLSWLLTYLFYPLIACRKGRVVRKSREGEAESRREDWKQCTMGAGVFESGTLQAKRVVASGVS